MCTPLPTPDASGIGENDARWPMPMRRRARHLAGDHRMVGRGQRRSRRHRHLELPRAVLGKKRVRRDAGGAHRRNETFAERPLAAERVQAVRVAVALLVAGIDELLLERGDQAQAGRGVQRGDRAAQELARAALPRRAVGVADVAQEEMLRRGTVARSPPAPPRRDRARSSDRRRCRTACPGSARTQSASGWNASSRRPCVAAHRFPGREIPCRERARRCRRCRQTPVPRAAWHALLSHGGGA